MSGFSTLDCSACGVNVGIQNDGNAPLVETPPEPLEDEDAADSLNGVEVVDGGVPRTGVTELAAALSASVKDLVSFLYLL